MRKSHYIPQFILRHFCEDEKLKYCDLKNQRVESRLTSSVFYEKGYYPDYLERALCIKIESQFAALLNKKILTELYRIRLNESELFLLKKYLIISVLRFRISEIEKDPFFEGMNDEEVLSITGLFSDNIDKILQCCTAEEMMKYSKMDNPYTNVILYVNVKDIIYSNIIFVKSNLCREDLVITDTGYADFEGAIHVKKVIRTIEMALRYEDPYLYQLAQIITPYDYSIFPMSKNLAIIAMSSFYQIGTKTSDYVLNHTQNGISFSNIFGFDNPDIIAAPAIIHKKESGDEYLYDIKQMSAQDVCFFNALLLDNSERFFAFANHNRIACSIKYASDKEKERDYRFALKKECKRSISTSDHLGIQLEKNIEVYQTSKWYIKENSSMKCNSLKEVRKHIDQIDREIIMLISERGNCVVQASRLKQESEVVNASEQIGPVVKKVRRWAQGYGADPDMIEALYREMISRFIILELNGFEIMKKKSDNATDN